MGLAGRKILVVEDSPLIAEALEAMLEDMDVEVVGPAGTIAIALELCETRQFDAAIVDLNIRGGKAYPIFHRLNRQAIPFVIASGYADWTMPDQWATRPRLAKPYSLHLVKQALEAIEG